MWGIPSEFRQDGNDDDDDDDDDDEGPTKGSY